MDWNVAIPIISGLGGVIAGGVVSFFSQRSLVGKQFLHDKEVREAEAQRWIDQMWWQKKESTYATIVEALWGSYHDFSEYENYVYSWSSEDSEAPTSTRSWHADRLIIEQAADMGAFYISTKASETVRDYVKYLYSINDYFLDNVSDLIKKTKSCLEAVKAEAARDLRIPMERQGL
jgi:hypothetical protein